MNYDNLLKRIESLEQEINNLKFSSKIPLNIQQAFEARLPFAKKSTHSGETKSVNEGGSATYTVMLPADAFLEVVVNGITYYLPAFT